MALNIIKRGGIASTRPGSASLPIEIDGTNIQGVTMFKPSSGPTSLVFMVDGLVYHSPYPFKTASQIEGLQFSPYSKFAAWASCVQSTDYMPDGTLISLDAPKRVLIIQDGATRAGMWDGSTARHLNPVASNAEFTAEGFDETPVGLWMKWSNNRLMVSRGPIVFFSDIGNPTKFHDSSFLAEGRRFYLPDDCTGMAETSDEQGVIAFTPNSGTFFKTSVLDRSQWLNTPDFQKTVLPNLGCIAPRSIVVQHGLIWWWSVKGLINQDDANRANVSSRLNVQDQEMSSSKSNVSYDVSGVAGAFFENFLLHAVPNGDRMNTRIHVLDQAPEENSSVNSWPSYWEGWRPVEFARGVIDSQERIFTISRDYDGEIRIWELFKNDRTDNGIPITCYVETKSHYFQNRDYKRFRYGEIEMVGILGEVAVGIAAAGVKGGFQMIGTKDISAIPGQIYHDVQYGEDSNSFYGSRPQSRTIKTRDGDAPSDCNEECIESEHSGLIDKAFSLLVVWSGVASLSAYRIFTISHEKSYSGFCEDDETDETRLLTPDGCSSTDLISDKIGFTTYLATATFNRINPATGLVVSNTATQSSKISQEDANRKASKTARFYVMSEIGEL